MKRFILFLLITLCHNALSQVDNVGSGRCLSFDGVDDYVDLGNIYDDVALPVTISIWIYIEPTSQKVTMPIFDSQDNSSRYNGFTMTVSTIPHIGITYGDGAGGNNPAYRRAKSGFFNTLTGRWVHVTGVIRGAKDMDIYLNGVNLNGVYEGTSNLPMNSNSPTEVAKIGYWFSNGILYRFKGLMDELCIWNRALSEAEVRQNMCKQLTGSEPGLIGYWDFNETSGLTLFDKSPNAFHGQLEGNPERVFSGAPIGDESVFQYTSNWNEFKMDDFAVTDIQGEPQGIHIYKVTRDPSQTSGLNVDKFNAPYFGVFAVSDGENSTFDIAPVCQAYVRTDNSVSVWDTKSVTSFLNRTEVIRNLDQSTSISVDLGQDLELCGNNSYILKSNVDPLGKSFLWSTGETTPEINVKASGRYKVFVMEGCSVAEDSVTIAFLPSPAINLELGDDVIVCNSGSYSLTTDLPVEGKLFLWSTGETTPEIIIRNSGEYHVEVSEGCASKRDTVFVTILAHVKRMVPNIITPNGDPLNQYFKLENLSDYPIRLEVFNRWGKVLYTSFNYLNDWDGGDLSPGIYFYRIQDECGKIYKGTLTICR